MALPRLLSSSEHQGQVTLSTPYFTICALKVQVTKETTHLHLPTWEAQGEPSLATFAACLSLFPLLTYTMPPSHLCP